MLGKAVTRIASTLAVSLLFVTGSVTSGHAQATTGKIQGRVITAGGQPIGSAQVNVDGTNLGNITNDEGFYFINEVPAGLHTIRAQSIGYRTQLVAEQRILAGQTTTLNFTLEQAAVAIDALVVQGERNPLVPRDQVSSRAIVTGETIDQLPLDNSSSIITLQPGVISTMDGFSIRGSREGEHGVYVDGVPVRNLRTGEAQTLELGTNSLAQVDVTTGGINARYGNSQSGVINYVTRTGGSTFGGSFSLLTDRLAPESIRGGFTRGELSLGGPIPRVPNLSFFVGTTLEGNKYGSTLQGNPYPIYVPSGVDTTFTLPRTGVVPGGTDSVQVVVPNFVEWDNGPTLPTFVGDEVNLTGKLSYSLGRGSKVDLSYNYNRDQSMSRGSASILNPDAWRGSFATENMLTAGGYFLITQSAEQALALDVKASWQKDWNQSGQVDREWQESHLFPTLGFSASNMDFIFDPDQYPVTDAMIQAINSGVLPAGILSVLPGRSDLSQRQGVFGIEDESLRLNPYAMRSSWPISGVPDVAGPETVPQSYTEETRMYLSATADWQMNRFNRLWIGGEFTRANSETMNVPLYIGVPTASRFEPTTGGLFVNDRLDIGDVVLEGGVRMDYYDPNGSHPRVTGYVTNVPDSLKGDYYTLRPGTEPWEERLEAIVDCGGAATAAARTNPVTGQAVCKNNFIKAKTRTIFSPKLAVSFPVTATSTFRLSYNQNVQPTALSLLLRANNLDLAVTNTNQTYGRDVDMPKTILFEAGYRQVFGGNTVLDASAYSKTTRNALTYRKVQYTDPNSSAPLFINTLTNADYSLIRGLDLKIDRRIGNIADLSVNYSFVDAKGTGSDPTTYTSIIFRRTTNLSVLTGQPVEPPEMLLTLDQSRAHTVSGTFSMLLDAETMSESRIGNSILSNLGVFATGRLASGLPYTRLRNDGAGQRLGQGVGLAGVLEEELNASRGPSFKNLDLRITKGFALLGRTARLVIDARNPFNIANTDEVFLETGTISNDVWYDQQISETLLNQNGTGEIIDRVIADWPENDLNRYMLGQAEKRFGNGDGVFTVEEQTNAWGTYFNYATSGSPWRMRTSEQSLRLGFEFVF